MVAVCSLSLASALAPVAPEDRTNGTAVDLWAVQTLDEGYSPALGAVLAASSSPLPSAPEGSGGGGAVDAEMIEQAALCDGEDATAKLPLLDLASAESATQALALQVFIREDLSADFPLHELVAFEAAEEPSMDGYGGSSASSDGASVDEASSLPPGSSCAAAAPGPPGSRGAAGRDAMLLAQLLLNTRLQHDHVLEELPLQSQTQAPLLQPKRPAPGSDGAAVSTATGSSSSSAGTARSGPPIRLGVTDPISLQESSEADWLVSERIQHELEVEFPTESAERMTHRQGVLREIERLFAFWTIARSLEAGLTAEEAEQQKGKVTTLGSFRLGVVHPGSDIDTLCIAPPNVRREDLFNTFVGQLEQHPEVTECIPIPGAYTPIIKLKMRGVCIDLLFARSSTPLASELDPEDIAKDDAVLRNMDEKCVRSINGFRVADQILRLVPNQDTFRRTLRFVKYWARRRGVYSNVLGFFGGITWSLLVARVCQLYPYYSPSQLLNRFFRLYRDWNWSKPVLLCEIIEPRSDPGLSGLKVWNPKTNPGDAHHVMPVITPAFPAMNSTYNVTETTKRILLDEFRRGYETVRRVELRQASWSKVHEPFPFFDRFEHFLWLEVLARHREVYSKFTGWVESRLRMLVVQLEAVRGMLVHPNPLQYDLRGSDPDWPLGCGMFIAIVFCPGEGAYAGQKVDLRTPMGHFMEVINQWPDKDAHAGLFRLRLRRVLRGELPAYVRDPQARKSTAIAEACLHRGMPLLNNGAYVHAVGPSPPASVAGGSPGTFLGLGPGPCLGLGLDPGRGLGGGHGQGHGGGHGHGYGHAHGGGGGGGGCGLGGRGRGGPPDSLSWKQPRWSRGEGGSGGGRGGGGYVRGGRQTWVPHNKLVER